MIAPIRAPLAALVLLPLVLVQMISAQTDTPAGSTQPSLVIAHSPRLQVVVDRAVEGALEGSPR